MTSGNQTQKKRRVNRFDLSQLSTQLAKVDRHLVSVIARRDFLARQVEEWKSLEENDPARQTIIRPTIEAKRLGEFAELAEAKGLSPDFARVILWAIIAESCRVQISQKQSRGSEGDDLFESDKPAWLKFLKDNLLKLASTVAPSLYDTIMYGDQAPFAIRTYISYENAILQRVVDTVKSLSEAQPATAVDLGCGTGSWSLRLAPYFQNVIGYDISPDMIERARKKAHIGDITNVSFVEADIEGPLSSLPNSSVSLIVMNLGTASDIPNIRGVLSMINRVLHKNGRFILSFYNSGALFYRWFIPWPISLIAEVNQRKHCLDVHSGKNTFQIYARPYTVREVTHHIRNSSMVESEIVTYPTIASILPDEFFDQQEAKHVISEIDRRLVSGDQGAYIIATGRKP